LKAGRGIRLAPLWALTLFLVVPLWASRDSDLGQAYGLYADWCGRLALCVLVALAALAIHVCLHQQIGARIERFVSQHFRKLLALYVLAYTAIFAALAIVGYLRFHSDVDYANFFQSLNSAAHGRFFTNCLSNAPREISIFADHNAPIMFLLLPIYMLLPYPSVLLVISTLILASTAVILSRYLTQIAGLDRTTTLCLCMAATLAPYFVSQNFEGLSIEMFAPPLFVLAFYLFEKERFWPFMLVLLLLNSLKEQVAIVMMVFVLIALARGKSARWAVGPFLLNAAMIFISFGLVIPHFRPTGAYKLLNPDTATSLADQAMAYLRHPASAVQQVLAPFRLTYVYIIAATNLFVLPFLALESLFVLPSLAKNILFVGWAANIMSKHALLMSGAMAVAVGKGVGKFALVARRKHAAISLAASARSPATRVLAILLLASSIAHIPVWSRNVNLAKHANHESKVELLKIIPRDAVIALPQDMLTRFSTRNKLYNSATPSGLTGFEMPVDYVVIDTSFHPEHYDYAGLLRAVEVNQGMYKGFKLTRRSDGLYLFERQRR